MELNEFTQKVRDQFLEIDQPHVTSEVEFRTLSTWDSLTGMAVLTMIEDEFKVTISVDDFNQLKTVVDLFNFVKSNK